MCYKSLDCKGTSGSMSLRGSSLAGIVKEMVKGISGKIDTTQGVLKMKVVYAVHFFVLIDNVLGRLWPANSLS